jgi:hypothetical protein
MKMINKAAVKRLEKIVREVVKPVRVWTLTETGRTPWFRLRPGDAEKYADPDSSRYQDIEINWVTPDPPHLSVRPGQESVRF